MTSNEVKLKQMHNPVNVLVTGGSGFIGSNFLLYMVPRHPAVRFVNLDKLTYAGNPVNLTSVEDTSNYSFVRGDISDEAFIQRIFQKNRFDTVVHFAAESHVDRSIMDPIGFVRTNVLGTAALLEGARRFSDMSTFRFYHISTDEVFGSLGDEGYFTEETPYDPRSPYSASKAGSDHLVRAYSHTYDLPTVISNCSNNYGPFQFPEKLIPLVIQNAMAGKEVPVYGEGRNVRDWLHVEDHVRAAERILLYGISGRTYAAGGRCEVRNIDIVEKLVDIVDEELDRPAGSSRKLISFVKDRPGHDYRYAIDCTRLEKELDWKPEHTLETGLRNTVRWYLRNRDWVEAIQDDSYREYYSAQYTNR